MYDTPPPQFNPRKFSMDRSGKSATLPPADLVNFTVPVQAHLFPTVTVALLKERRPDGVDAVSDELLAELAAAVEQALADRAGRKGTNRR